MALPTGTGRHQNEVSGGRDGAKVERIDAAIQTEERIGGTGTSTDSVVPDSYERKDTTVDPADSKVLRRPAATSDLWLRQEYIDTACEVLIVDGSCTVCHEAAGLDHIRKFLIAADKAEDILIALNQMPLAPEQVKRDTLRTINNPHVLAVDEKIVQFHKNYLADGKKARKLERLGRKAKREFLRESDLRQEEQSRQEGWIS